MSSPLPLNACIIIEQDRGIDQLCTAGELAAALKLVDPEMLVSAVLDERFDFDHLRIGH